MHEPVMSPDARTLPLRAALKGSMITAGDPGYDEARSVFYSGIDRRPAAIVRAADTTDVAQVVSWARESGMELAVRSGGHSLAGHGVSDGGIVLDLSGMRALEVDASRRTAWAQTGLTAGAYTTAVGAYGLATGFGDAASVGIGGITLGGGVGFLHRKHGLTLDNLLAAEIVTADRRLLLTDAETHSDLFWAIRGGGGNFGVATRFRYQLHEVDRIIGGMLILPATAEVITSFLAAADSAPEELSGVVNIMLAPPMPFIPAEHHGRPIVMALLAYAGPVEAGERAMTSFRAVATPLVDQVRPMRYAELYEGAAPHPVAVAVRSLFVDHIDRPTAELVLDRLQASNAPMRVAQFRVLGGAVARVPAHATAFAHRTRRVMATVAAAYERSEEAPEHDAWVTSFAAALSQDIPGVYVGFLGDEGGARVREAYPGPAWERLMELKARYDPTNLFRLNQNIPPATPAGLAA